MEPTENIKRLLKKLSFDADPQAHQRILNDALAAQAKTKTSKNPAASTAGIWRTIMKSPITKLAAAAVVLIAVLIGIHHFNGAIDGTSVAWGDVIKPILNARTVVLDIVIGSGEKKAVIHDELMGPRIRRTVSGMEHGTVIIDFEQKRLLTLDTAKKTAVYIGISGLGDLKNYIEVLRDTITRLQNQPDFHVDNKGLQKIDSREYVVFVADSNNQTITIWADPKTALPIRIEQKTPNMQIVCDNMQFDVPLDESQFSMEVPSGYEVIQNAGVDFKKSSESDFIESLRIWAQIMDGNFPDSLKLEDIVKAAPKFGQALDRANLTKQQQLDIATRWGQGLVFIRFFKGQGEWHYSGKGVKLGDANTPIFWYQPQDSQTWRVVYGDLNVKDVSPENLPK